MAQFFENSLGRVLGVKVFKTNFQSNLARLNEVKRESFCVSLDKEKGLKN